MCESKLSNPRCLMIPIGMTEKLWKTKVLVQLELVKLPTEHKPYTCCPQTKPQGNGSC